MNRSLGAAALKRKRPETVPQGLVDAERAILNSIKSKQDLGIWIRDIKVDTKLTDHVVNKSLKSLIAKNLVKEVVNIQNKGKKHYMAVEFEPSKEISGGEWYIDGNLDKELINILQDLCLRCIRAQRVATLQGMHNELKKNGVINFEISAQQVAEILNSMVLDDVIIEVKSTGLADYHSIPIGTICYRVASGAGVAKGSKMVIVRSQPESQTWNTLCYFSMEEDQTPTIIVKTKVPYCLDSSDTTQWEVEIDRGGVAPEEKAKCHHEKMWDYGRRPF